MAAGDLSDITNDNLTGYTTAYKNELSSAGANPSVWAVHAYAATHGAPPPNGGDSPEAARLLGSINSYTDGKPTWITEVGAYYCVWTDTGVRGLNYQNGRAIYLKNTLLPRMPARLSPALADIIGARRVRTCACRPR